MQKIVDLNFINLLDIGTSMQLTGMVLQRECGTTYLLLLPGRNVKDDVKIKTVRLSHENWKKLITQLDLHEVEIFREDKGKLKRIIIRKCTRQIESRISWNVYRRDNYTCRYCGRNDVPLTVDHLVLWEVGGPSIEENLVASCKRCNNKRGNMPYAEWITSPEYKKLSKDLHHLSKAANIYLVNALDKIPIRVNKRKR